jgi:hypothetical protein
MVGVDERDAVQVAVTVDVRIAGRSIPPTAHPCVLSGNERPVRSSLVLGRTFSACQ